ncbi:MAG: SIMPL domain-containing protein [Candidatus Methanoperedenaceae archaeon]|nr:SIMPL domain-containing protein [Candidatus Methanoperedenaceae archaeon]MDW7727334.1 SIMPL domain-containing protein [Candidatus Methanoperedens sp.]
MTQEISNNKLYLVIAALSIAIVLMAFALMPRAIQGQENTLFVSGSAEKSIAPDTASLSIGVVVQASTAMMASDENAVLMSAVISELNNLGLEAKDIQTSMISIHPVYAFNGAQTIVSYSASNNVRVTTNELDIVSEIIDRSTAAGANQIGGVSFSVSEEKQKEIRDELLAGAVTDASSKANKLAENLDIRIVGVKTASISDVGFPQPFFRDTAFVEERAATPIQPGEMEVTLSVQVTYIVR